MKSGSRGFVAAFFSLGMCLMTGCSQQTVNLDKGMTAIEELNYEEALDCFELALLEGEDKQLVNRGRGIAYIGMSDYEQAIASLTESLQNCDGHITELEFDTNFYLALAYYKSAAYEEALETYSAILSMDEKNVEAYYGRGLCKLKLGQAEEACSDFDMAVGLEPKNYALYIDIYSALAEEENKDMGMRYLQTALEADDRKKSDYDQGRIYYYMEDYNTALVYFDSATRSTGGDAYLFLGKSYEALGDYNYAASVYINYLSEHSDAAEIYNQLGICKLTMGQYEEALEAFQSGLSCEDASLYQSLKLNEITAYEYLGNFTQAKALMENYLSVYPDDAVAVREYTFLKTRS